MAWPRLVKDYLDYNVDDDEVRSEELEEIDEGFVLEKKEEPIQKEDLKPLARKELVGGYWIISSKLNCKSQERVVRNNKHKVEVVMEYSNPPPKAIKKDIQIVGDPYNMKVIRVEHTLGPKQRRFLKIKRIIRSSYKNGENP